MSSHAQRRDGQNEPDPGVPEVISAEREDRSEGNHGQREIEIRYIETPLHQFLDQWALEWSEGGQLAAAFFALTGLSPNRTHRLAVSIPETSPEPEEVYRQFDIDSIRGIICEGQPWPFTGHLEVYPIGPPSETVSRSSRYKFKIRNRVVRGKLCLDPKLLFTPRL